MAQQRRGLGKGLGALIPDAPPNGVASTAYVGPSGTTSAAIGIFGDGDGAASGAGGIALDDSGLRPIDGVRFARVPLDSITPNPRQPRTTFDEEALDELAASITEVGLLQPIVVRPAGDDRYELVMGERRWRATQRAGLDEIPAIIRSTPDTDMLRDALLENLHRQQLDPLEEAAAYQQLLAEFGATHEQLAQKVGRSRPHISNTLRLLNLPPAVQKRVAAGVISAGHARALLSLDTPYAQERLAQRIVAEGLSVRAVEEIVAIGDDDQPKAPRKAPVNKPVAPALRHLSDRLSDIFETRVKVEMGRNKGKITVEFASIDDLERIVKTMSPDAATPRQHPAG